MSRISMIASALIVGLLAGTAANARANSKQKNDHKQAAHKFTGLSPVDFPHKEHGRRDRKDHNHHGKEHHNGDDNCGKNSSTPPKEYMGGSVYSPPGTPGNPVMPSKPTLPRTPIKFYGLKTAALATSLFNQHKNLTPPGGGRPGQGHNTPNQGYFIKDLGLDPVTTFGLRFAGGLCNIGHIGSVVGSTGVQIAEGMYTGVSGLVGEAGSLVSGAVSDIGSWL
jgi:hypothetical protein